MGYSTLKAALDAVVKTNGRQQITGSNLNGVMTQILQGVDILDRANPEDTSGMNHVVLKKNKTFSEQLTGTNTIYEIRDSFNLSGESVAIPAGSVLLFNGGKVLNGSITMNKTRIVAGLEQIFGTNVTISGTLDMERWECAWFGAVNDGVMAATEGVGATFSGTDNFDAIQCTIYNALQTNIREIHIHQGNFRLTKPIFLGYEEYNNCKLFGDGFTLVKEGANAATRGTALYFDTEIGGIFVNSSRGTTISEIGLYCKNNNFMVNNGVLNVSDQESDWYYTTIQKHNGLDCAGISVDAIMKNTDFVPFSTSYGMDVNPNNIKYSSYVQINNVTIIGFYSGIDLQVTSSTSGSGDYVQMGHVDVAYCVHGIRNYANQSRKLDVNYCRFADLHTAFSNNDSVHGRNGNMQGEFRLCDFGFLYQIFDIRSNPIALTFSGGENIYRFGKYTNSGNAAPIQIFGGWYNFRQSVSNQHLGIIPLVESNVSLYEWGILYNASVSSGADTNHDLILPWVISFGQGNSLPYNRCIYLQLMVNGYQSMPEFIIQKTPTNVTGLDLDIAYSSSLIKVGDYLCDIATNGVFEVKSVGSGTMTLTALTYIKGTSIDTTKFDTTRNINWYKINKPETQLSNANGVSIVRSALPTASEYYTKGMWKYSVPYTKPAWWNGERFVDALGFAIARSVGTTAQRPTLTTSDKGFNYYDTQVNKPIWWNGTAWIDATGTAV